MPKPTTLRLCLLEQAFPPQLDFLLFALASLRPAGDDLVVPDEVLAETRRVFADLRRVLAATPLPLPDPVAPITRGQLRPRLIEALELFVLYKEEQRQGAIMRRREARKTGRSEKNGMNLSPRPFAFIE
jgi:hypothetical protein